jgi:glycosyltransferase involved in cell wall biosynthesis
MDLLTGALMTDTRCHSKEFTILYLITGLRLGGAERQLLLLSDQIRAAGYKVLVVAMESDGIMANSFKNKGITVLELDIKGVESLFTGYKKMKTIVDDFSPDIIHSHMIHANLFGRIFKFFNPRYKLINTAHNIKEGNRFLMKGYSLTRILTDWSTNVSMEALDHYVKQGYFNRNCSSYIPNAIDTEEFSPNVESAFNIREQMGLPPNAYVFFSAGRLHEQKNYQLLVHSFKIVLNEFPSAVLIIAGEGPLYAELKELSSLLGIAGQIFFLGRREDVPSLLNMCNCFVLSSWYEGFGMVIAEALATMKPVIATDCGGVKEVMSNYGTLIKTGDLKALAAAMISEISFPSKVEDLVNGREHIKQNYAIAGVIKQWVDLYHRKF